MSIFERWTNADIMQDLRKRDNLKAKADTLLKNDAFIEFKKTRNKIKRDVIKAKRSFIMNKINDAKNNPKQYWNELYRVFNPKIQTNSSISLSDDGRDIPPLEIPDYMNDFFANVGSNLAQAINTDNSNYLLSLKDTVNNLRHKLISWRPTNLEEISNLIESLDTSKSSKIKNINAIYYKDCLLCSADKVTLLFNRFSRTENSLTNGRLLALHHFLKTETGNQSQITGQSHFSL